MLESETHLHNDPLQVTLDIENKQCKGLQTVKTLEIEDCQLVDIRNLSNGLSRHLIKFPATKRKQIPEADRERFTLYRKRKGEISAWFDTEGCVVCRTMLAFNSFLISARKLQGYNIAYSFVAPNPQAFQNIMAKLDDAGIATKVLEISKFTAKGNLTPKQEMALWVALKMGFFDYPRKTHLTELSRRMKLAPSTLSEILRRGMRRALERHFETLKKSV